jgi:hypothetical protein
MSKSTMEKKICFDERAVEIQDRPCVIEFQAFRGNNNEYIIKELVFLDLVTGVVFPFLFQPPFSFNNLNNKAKTTNRWTVKHFHHIDWCEGFTSYKNLESVMYHFCNQFTAIYTRGLEKRNWIGMYTTCQVYNVTLDKRFDLRTCDNLCTLAKNKLHKQTQCALKNAYRLAAFLEPVLQMSGGGSDGYKYRGEPLTNHEYYSRLEESNIN